MIQSCRSALVFGAAEDLGHGEVDVLVDRQPGQQAVVLEHHGAVGSGAVDLLVLEQHGAGRDLGQPGDQVEQRRLAAAGMADDRDEFALVDGQLDVLEHFGDMAAAGEGLVDMVELQIGGHRSSPQFAVVPRVTKAPTAATSRSRQKPTTPI